MFWHENKENDINLIPYSRNDYMKMISKKNLDKKDANLNDIVNENKLNFYTYKNIADFSELFRVGMTVSSDWGPGVVVSVNKEEKKVKVKIEGIDQDFDMISLHPFLKINVQVYLKDKKGNDKRARLLMRIFLDDTVGKLKNQIAEIFGSEGTKIILVHNFMRVNEDNKKIVDMSLFNEATLLFIIKGNSNY